MIFSELGEITGQFILQSSILTEDVFSVIDFGSVEIIQINCSAFWHEIFDC